MLRSLELPDWGFAAAAERAAASGIACFATPFDRPSLAMLLRLGVPALKIGSGDLTNTLLIREAAAAGRPLIISTGMATLAEVERVVVAVRTAGDPPLALLHCTSSYPAPVDEANLRAIATLKSRFGVEVGYSDHTPGQAAAAAAVALGATILEKHLTIDRGLPGPDHAASLDPKAMTMYVRMAQDAHAALGDGLKVVMPAEVELRTIARRSLVARRRLPPGHRLGWDDLDAMRPATGIAADRVDDIVGRRLRRELASGERILGHDLDPPLAGGSD